MNTDTCHVVESDDFLVSLWRRFVRFPLVRVFLAVVWVTIPFLFVQRLIPLLPLGKTSVGILKALACTLVSCGAYIAYVRTFERRRADEFAPRAAAKELAGGILIGALLFGATIAILASLGVYRLAGTGEWSKAILPLAVALVIGTFEEIVFRGILFRIAEESLGTWIALLISAAIFGALHLIGPDGTLVGALAIVVGASVLLTGAYKATGRLWLPMGIHVAWNFTQGGIFGVTVSGHPGEGLFQGTLTGPNWLSGGAFGAEASVVAIVLCSSAGLLFFSAAVRKGLIVQPNWRRK
jgi:membrane protease YdiL (CAAX protease family)